MHNSSNQSDQDISKNETGPSKEKLPPLIMAACCWPIALVAFGGLIGGLFGGVACAVNISLYKSNLPRWSLWLLNPLVGVTALVLYLVVAIAVGLAIAE